MELRGSNEKLNLANEEMTALVDGIAKNSSFLLDYKLTPELASQIAQIWDDNGMKETFEVRRLSHVMDNTPYFFAKVEELAKEGYNPSFDDYVRVRDQTTGKPHPPTHIPSTPTRAN